MNDKDNQEKQNSLNPTGTVLGISNLQHDISALKQSGLSNLAAQTAKKGAKEGAKEGAKAMAEAGAASTGAGAAPVIAEKVASLGAKTLENATEDISGSKIKLSDIFMVVVCVVFFIYIGISAGAIHGNVGASSEKYQEDQYHNYRENKGISGFLKSLFFKFFDTDDEIGEYQLQYPLNESLSKNISIINKGLYKAYELAELECTEIIIKEQYDYELTMESFYSNGDPYENINYAELISVISESDAYNIENVKFSTFKKLFNPALDNKNLKYMYCMKIEEDFKTVRFYVFSDGLEVRLSEGEAAPDEGGHTYEKEVRYGKVLLYPYDLKSVYEMLELDPYVENSHWNASNIDILESQEKYLRFYARDYNLGPEERTIWDYGFDRIDISLGEQDYQEYLDLIGSGNISEMAETLIEAAFSKLGTAYSQAHRNEEGYYDCSSFVAACYRQIGIEFGNYSPVAADICKYLEKSSHMVSAGYTGEMQPGDLIFYSSNTNGRYKNITHVAMYVGNGKIIDASSSRGQVVYRNIWGRNEIVSVCRPLE